MCDLNGAMANLVEHSRDEILKDLIYKLSADREGLITIQKYSPSYRIGKAIVNLTSTIAHLKHELYGQAKDEALDV